MVLELESGGNVRFEEGTPADLWYVNLIRLCYSEVLQIRPP